MSKTHFTLSLVFISILLFAITPAFANDCDPNVDYNTLGHQQYEQGEYNLAVASFTCELQADPEAAQVYNARGNAYRNLADYISAIVDYDKAIEIDEEYAIAYNNRGWSHFKLEDKDQALVDYDKALELDPDLAYAYNNRGLLFLLDGKEELATADFNRAIELGLPVNWAEYNLDLISANTAETTPEIEVNTENPDTDSELKTYVDQAFDAYNHRDFANAVELFTQALEIDPDHFLAHYYRGNANLILDEFEAAFADFSWMVETKSSSPDAYWERAVAAASLGDFDQANTDAIAAYRLAPDHVNNFIVRGYIASHSGNPIAAGQQFQHFLESYDTEPVTIDGIEPGETITLPITTFKIYVLPFAGEVNQTLHITADSTDLFPVIILLDVKGNPINGATGNGLGSSSVMDTAQLPEDGIYTLLVSHAGDGSSGEVDVTIEFTLND